jgi:RHS repeat-associated protein
LLSSTGTTVNSFLYTGEQRDDAAGLYYLHARYYDSAIGRFLSQDPYPGSPQEPSSLHKYAYVQNNPVNMTDPTGLYGFEEGTAAHQLIGRYYIGVWGDWFVGKGKPANKGFGSRPGWGAYNRMIWFGDESPEIDTGRHDCEERLYSNQTCVCFWRSALGWAVEVPSSTDYAMP